MVNINPAYRLRELKHALTHSGVSVILAARGFRDSNYVAMIDELAPKLPTLKQTVYLGREQLGSAFNGDDLLENGKTVSDPELREREASLQFDDPVNIQYTSGTTGSPKGATLSHHNILNNGFFVGEALRYSDDRICLPVPFYHCFGCVLGNLAASRTERPSSFRASRSIQSRRSARLRAITARRSTACRRCSSPC